MVVNFFRIFRVRKFWKVGIKKWEDSWLKSCYHSTCSLINWVDNMIRRKHTVNFLSCDVITADYTIIMSRTLKVTGNHVMYDRGARFLRVIVSSSHALCCLLSVKKQKYDFNFSVQCVIIQLLDLVFVIFRIIKVSVRVISLRLWLITPTSTSIILDITKASSNSCLLLYIELAISFLIGRKRTVNFRNQRP